MRRAVLLAVAAALTAIDLAEKASRPVYGHPRSALYVVAGTAAVLALVVLVPRVPSLALSVCAGVAAAGALGNAVSAAVWRGGVPNPIVVGDVAFNVADVCAVLGAVGLVGGAALFALRHPALLRQPV
jgi:lipoprotein signal peptidase